MQKKKLLIVDDEAEIRMLLKEYLELEGYRVLTAASAKEADRALVDAPDLILLDVSMPGTDGLLWCEQIRNQVQAPVLFLSARTEEEDRIKGFRAGGDDYILKPFSMEELSARIEAHLRREDRKERGKQGERKYSRGDLTVDFTGYRILKNGRDIGLTKMEFRIAELLFTNKGQVFTKEHIYEKVRGFDGEADAAVITEHIRRIRSKLGTGKGQEYIETVWGVGYRWIG
ncbi:MAG: response regulator transcription factor [Lachnospiraceae bacterium]|nr:response regulator transcription factor [Lachnospiraceae bacterium]